MTLPSNELDQLPACLLELIFQLIPIKHGRWLLASLNHSLRDSYLEFIKQTSRFCANESLHISDAMRSPLVMLCLPYARDIVLDHSDPSVESAIVERLRLAVNSDSLRSLKWTSTQKAMSESPTYVTLIMNCLVERHVPSTLVRLDLHRSLHEHNPSSTIWRALARLTSLTSLSISIPFGMRFETLEPLLSFVPQSVTHLKCDKSAANGFIWTHAFRSTQFLPRLAHFDSVISFPGVGESLAQTIMQQTSSLRPVSTIKLYAAYPEDVVMFPQLTSLWLAMGSDNLCNFASLAPDSLLALSELDIALLEKMPLMYDEFPIQEVDIMPLLLFVSRRPISRLHITFRDSVTQHYMAPLSDAAVDLLSSMSLLTSLEVKQVGSDLFASHSIQLPVRCWSHLEHLELHGRVTNDNARSLVLASPNVKSLTLHASVVIIYVIAVHCPHITRLSLSCHRSYIDNMLSLFELEVASQYTKQFAYELKHLIYLDIRQFIEDDALHALLTWLASICRLSYLQINNPARLPATPFSISLQRSLTHLKAMLTCCHASVTELMQQYVKCIDVSSDDSDDASITKWSERAIVQSISNNSNSSCKLSLFKSSDSRDAFFESLHRMLTEKQLDMLSSWARSREHQSYGTQ